MKITLSKKLYGLTGGLLGILMIMFIIALIGLTYLSKQYQALTEHSAAKMMASMDAEVKLGLAIVSPVGLYSGWSRMPLPRSNPLMQRKVFVAEG